MRRLSRPKHTLVVVLIACLLRALLPIDDGAADVARAPSSGEEALQALDFPCAGHQCGCHTREHCLAACCCFPRRASERAPAGDLQRASTALAIVAANVSADASGRNHGAAFVSRIDRAGPAQPVAFIQALKCAGGAPHSVATSSPLLSTQPERTTWSSIDESSRADEHVVSLLVESRRPDPSTPPPRARPELS